MALASCGVWVCDDHQVTLCDLSMSQGSAKS